MIPNIAEINLIGTGGGYGESLIIHVGNNEWIIVDSCYNPDTKKSLPLELLVKKEVELNSVKLIVCTHWHDDHIRGISEILEKCEQAIFSFARANDLKKFLQFVSLDYEKLNKIGSNSSTKEFNKCLEILKTRTLPAKLSEKDKLLYSTKYNDLFIEIHSLSPSDYSSQLFDVEISSLITEFGQPNQKMVIQSPNDRSVVLLLKLGYHNILLGADLEVCSDSNRGWLDITRNSEVVKISEKSRYFKIPHHGSQNGFHQEIWDNLVEILPISTITPWNKKKKLPPNEMVERYKKMSKELYITTPTDVSKKPKKRTNRVTKIIKQFNSSVQEIKYRYGLISCTIDISDKNSIWKTTLEGTSCKVV
ncbi:MAG: MBL fold metallo-hydrolase [Microscillaceae bacterium]|nr:MBL fold metallo-hydrolase [Microscillaceae bacterium]